MAWVVTASLARLMADFRATFPAKSRASDGTIGDTAHQAETSGHNPDDTSGSRAEYSDADSIPEVRAIDVDNELHDPHGVTMEQVVQRLLATPADRDRLMYVIYNRRIWRKRNGWRQEAYTGSSPHTEHAHFSGDPASDDNAAAWTSVTSFKETKVALADETLGSQTKSGDHAAPRNGNEALSDLYALRLVLIGQKTLAEAGFAETSPLAMLLNGTKIVSAQLTELITAVNGGQPPVHENGLDSAAEERIAARAAQLVADRLTALVFRPDPAAAQAIHTDGSV